MAASSQRSLGRKRFGKMMMPVWRASWMSQSFMCMAISAQPRASAGTSGGTGCVASRYSRIAVDS